MAKKKVEARVLEPMDKKYELVLILQPELLASALEKKLKEFEAYLVENGGIIDLKDVWGKQDLAYRIGKHDAGLYVVYNLTLPTTFNQELDEHMRIDKDIIRSLMVSLKEGYEYQKFEEEVLPAMKEEPSNSRNSSRNNSHKADDGGKKAEVKDKGKKADAASLDEKLGDILKGGDVKV